MERNENQKFEFNPHNDRKVKSDAEKMQQLREEWKNGQRK